MALAHEYSYLYLISMETLSCIGTYSPFDSIEFDSIITPVPIEPSSDCVHSMILLNQGDRDSERGVNEHFICDEIAQCADVGAGYPGIDENPRPAAIPSSCG